ncbi:MAG TPA: hypothetical protein VEO95_06890, partial [Chthoniobacteraceae bacterium]|nr:hypothetical protein [Chthoniobacteraceae bacterium]
MFFFRQNVPLLCERRDLALTGLGLRRKNRNFRFAFAGEVFRLLALLRKRLLFSRQSIPLLCERRDLVLIRCNFGRERRDFRLAIARQFFRLLAL